MTSLPKYRRMKGRVLVFALPLVLGFSCLGVHLTFASVRRRKGPLPRNDSGEFELKLGRKPVVPLADGPILPFDAALQEAWEKRSAADTHDTWSTTAAEAEAQDRLLGSGSPLMGGCKDDIQAVDIVSEVSQDGVALVPGALPVECAGELRRFVLQDLADSREKLARDPQLKHKLFSKNIRQTRAAERSQQTRWELKLPSNDITQAALRHLLAGPVGAAFEALAGGADAEFWEFTALVSMPGAVPQCLHCDTGFDDACVFTAFVALQKISREMGPTRFVPCSHTKEAHGRFSASETTFLNGARSVLALLQEGDAALYNSRLLHCATGNLSEEPRVLFVVSFRHASAEPLDSSKKNTKKTARAYSDSVRLRDLRE